MKLYYFVDPEGNFGDDLNPWLWNNVFPDYFDDDTDNLFVGVGTLLNHRLPPSKAKMIFGSGAGYGKAPIIDHDWRFYFVRGPLTAKKLGLDKNIGITDPAILTPQFYNRHPVKKYKYAYIPHCLSAALGDWETICRDTGIKYIDPRNDYFDVFEKISQTEILLSEAMHGSIIADAFRIPWIPVRCYDHISSFKWNDWGQSIGLDIQFNTLSSIWKGEIDKRFIDTLKIKTKRSLYRLGIWSSNWQMPYPAKSNSYEMARARGELITIAKNGRAYLSTNSTMESNLDRIFCCIEKFKQDFGLSR